MKDMRILLVDDHAMLRHGLRMLLGEANLGAHVTEAESIEQAMALEVPLPDLILLDLKLPGISGLEGIPLLKRRWPQAIVVMLSALDTPEAMTEALASGAAGYVSKAASPDLMLALIANAMERGGPPAADTSPEEEHLTPRQRDILNLLCLGMSNKLIARQLDLSENTVRRHVQDILQYFQVESRSEAVLAAQRRGLV